MGLLTSPQARGKLSQCISRYSNIVCALSYCVGLIWFLGLAHKDLNGGTYFSENALLPGLVESDFNSDHGASNFFNDLKTEVKQIKSERPDDEQVIPLRFLADRFSSIGVEVYAQNYTVNYPFQPPQRPLKYRGMNVYAIVRGLRASGTEALVISAPYRPYTTRNGTLAGIALMYGLAAGFRKQVYWAKDIIFLFTDNEEYGMQAWLSAYHHTPSHNIETGELAGRSGAIQAALNLEISQSTISYMDIKVEGLNGQLPNLDLVNTAVRLCRRERIAPSLHQRLDYWSSDSWDGYIQSLYTMMYMMWHQALGMPSANHGLFHRYNVEAITLQGVRSKYIKPQYGFVEIGRVIEGIVRSLNNLLERFHQSFFFYLLPSTERYASIGVYLPPFGLLALPAILKALALWLDYSSPPEKKTNDKPDKSGFDDKQTSADDSSDPVKMTKPDESAKTEEVTDDDDTAVEDPKADFHTLIYLMSYLPYILMPLFFGLLTLYGPYYFIVTATPLHLSPAQGMAVGLLAIHVAVILSPALLQRKLKSSKVSDKMKSGADARVIKCISLLMLGLILGATAVLNIALAFFIAVVWIPTFLVIKPVSSGIGRLLQRLLLVLVSPLGLACISSAIHLKLTNASTSSDYTADDLYTWASEIWNGVGEGLYAIVLQSQLLDNWTYGLLALTALPNWILMTLLLGCSPYQNCAVKQ